MWRERWDAAAADARISDAGCRRRSQLSLFSLSFPSLDPDDGDGEFCSSSHSETLLGFTTLRQRKKTKGRLMLGGFLLSKIHGASVLKEKQEMVSESPFLLSPSTYVRLSGLDGK